MIEPSFNSVESTVEDRLHDVKVRLEQNQTYYGHSESSNPTLGTFATAALLAFERPFFVEQLRYALSIREEIDASHMVKLLERSYQADLLEHDAKNYPDNYRYDTELWLDTFQKVENTDERYEKVIFNLLTRNVQSNIAERYKTLKLLACLYQERFPNGPSHLDVGSSLLHGSLKLAYNDITDDESLSFGKMKLKMPDEGRLEGKTDRRLNSKVITRLANIALSRTVPFGEMIGTDITNVNDPSTKKWVESCSFYPDELTDNLKRREFAELETIDPEHERVAFIRADFSNNSDIHKLQDAAPAEGFDMISFFTVFYQISEHDRAVMLGHAKELLSENGLIVIQDAIDGNFSKNWNYRTLLHDVTRPDLGTQEILRWKTPRCTEAIAGLGRLSVGGQLHRFDQALTLNDYEER